MKILRTIADCRRFEKAVRKRNGRIGFVPTMGALHSGHQSLLKRARKECDVVVLSVFINPTQFNDPNDLKKYPKTLKSDLEIASGSQVDAVFIPNAKTMYPEGYRYRITENQMSLELCGAHRPGHFDGVLTVVMKLFQAVRPDRAYFGEKDYQQLMLVKGMIEAFFLPIELIACPTVREKDGLAMSSRNLLLTREERKQAPLFSRILKSGKAISTIRSELERSGFQVDYIEKKQDRIYGAVRLGRVRLIDNVATRGVK